MPRCAPVFGKPPHPNTWENAAWLYFVHLWNGKESFLKVGITTKKTTRERFKKDELFWKTQRRVPGTLKAVYDAEQSILNDPRVVQFRYRPVSAFKGSSECFTMEAYRVLLELILDVERVLTKPDAGTIEVLFSEAA